MPEATQVRKSNLRDGAIVVVTFDDGHRVSFFPVYEGFGDPISIGQIKIESANEQPVAKFFSPYQYPICFRNRTDGQPDYGFQPVELPHLTLEQIVEYLTKAVAYVAHRFTEKGSSYGQHMNIVSLANNEIARIEQGEYQLPA